ncbi:hypothetical protein DY000_02050000 [Brassica cretica]|uniref:Uncharacterized protein n=1 Tax=Brassica cretica TaxID=69181 RepID=A0ABQ7F664_BRACR|nr:hypothetical protein DY000_02050000 [Brassica cretica]
MSKVEALIILWLCFLQIYMYTLVAVSCCDFSCGLLFNLLWQRHCLLRLRSCSVYILKINMLFMIYLVVFYRCLRSGRDLGLDLEGMILAHLCDELKGLKKITCMSVPKKKGRLVGLGRRTRSVPPSSAPPPFVDPEVLTAQLKDKDDRISLLETQMAAQQAGYEAQKRLNQQMMEMMQRMYPNEVFPNVQDP